MKTQFKNHIKFGSCWYDTFFKTTTKQKTPGTPVNKEKENEKNLNFKIKEP